MTSQLYRNVLLVACMSNTDWSPNSILDVTNDYLHTALRYKKASIRWQDSARNARIASAGTAILSVRLSVRPSSILITANMQSETGFPSSHQLKSYVASKSRLKLAARAVLPADAGLLVS